MQLKKHFSMFPDCIGEITLWKSSELSVDGATVGAPLLRHEETTNHAQGKQTDPQEDATAGELGADHSCLQS